VRALPLYKPPHPTAFCDRCGLPETTLHIFFECPAVHEVVDAVQPLHKALFGSELKWEQQAILPLSFTQRRMRSLKLFFVAAMYRLLWTLRNKRKHGEKIPAPQAVPSAIDLELARAASTDWALTREALRKDRIGKGAASMEYVRKQIKAFKKRWAIPRFFRLDDTECTHSLNKSFVWEKKGISLGAKYPLGSFICVVQHLIKPLKFTGPSYLLK